MHALHGNISIDEFVAQMQEEDLGQLVKALSKRWGSKKVVVAATKTATFDELGALANALDDRFRINPSRPVKGWASLDDQTKKQRFYRLKMLQTTTGYPRRSQARSRTTTA